ncbi:3-dehydroquinate dehydratase [bacterium]|nr:3-dehydroquinate dehydratase [candidate division CSSED10-310 bacterium]
MKKVHVIHGPNLDLLGIREEGHYGSCSLEELNQLIQQYADSIGLAVSFFQSNREDLIIERIRTASREANAVILNPAGLGYSSLSLRDAIITCSIPVVEVHLSNIAAREKFRQKTIISDVCCGQISGFREFSYLAALLVIDKIISKSS